MMNVMTEFDSSEFVGTDADSNCFSLSKHEWQLDNFRDLAPEQRLSKTIFIFKPNQEPQLELTLHLGRTIDIDGLVTCVTLDVVNTGLQSVCAAVLILAVTGDNNEMCLEASQWRPKRVGVGEKWSYGQFCCDSDLAMKLVQGSLVLRLVFKTFADLKVDREVTGVDRERRLVSDVSKLFCSAFLWDVRLVCENASWKCHKALLAARSDVFAAMFASDMAESRDNVVRVDMADAQAVGHMIEYMYTARIGYFEDEHSSQQSQAVTSSEALNIDRLGQLMHLADRYQLPELKSYCYTHLVHQMSPNNVCQVARLALFDDRLQIEAVECIANNPAQVINSEEWIELQREMPQIANTVIMALSRRLGHQ